jgi:hypothetical protein
MGIGLAISRTIVEAHAAASLRDTTPPEALRSG